MRQGHPRITRTAAMRELHAAAIAWADGLDAADERQTNMDALDGRLFEAATQYRNAYKPKRRRTA